MQYSFTTLGQDIFRTVCQGDLLRLDSLLQYESIYIEDNRGRSLLHWAVACEQKEVFDFLIEKGIDPDQEDNENKTAMYVAVFYEKEEYFDLLLDLQKDDSWIDKQGTNLVESAILNQSELFVRKLIEAGVNINQENTRGSTPIEIAKRIKATEIYDLLLSLGADESKIREITLSGRYLGQEPPGIIPKLFAPNFISTEESEFGAVFNLAGDEFYFAVDVNGKSEIRYSRMIDNQWTQPEIILSHEIYGYNDPFLSNDENRLYFISKRALDGVGELKDYDIWYAQKTEEGWSEPINVGTNINSKGNEYYISFTNEGTMYFSSNVNSDEENKSNYDIYYSKFIEGEFQEAMPLPKTINTEDYEADVFIAPDESYIIFCSTREDSFGRGDLYISFKNTEDNWTEAVNMGDKINTQYYEYCPFVSKDGKYLFYTSNQDIYWVSTEIINQLKENNFNK